jgi:hypothetical protein
MHAHIHTHTYVCTLVNALDALALDTHLYSYIHIHIHTHTCTGALLPLSLLYIICTCTSEVRNTSEIRQNTPKYVTKSTYSALYPCIEHTAMCIRYALFLLHLPHAKLMCQKMLFRSSRHACEIHMMLRWIESLAASGGDQQQ